MKKVLSLILAVIMLLGCISVTAFAEGNTTDITATVPDITYNIVIPASTALTEENHTDVLLGGTNCKATVEITAHPSDSVNIYYTVDLLAGNLTDGNGHTITTSYTYAQGGNYSELTADTKVTVYTGGQVVDSTIKVTADDTEWMASPSGDYAASVVFNFVTEKVVTMADVMVTGAQYQVVMQNPNETKDIYTYQKTADGFSLVSVIDGVYFYDNTDSHMDYTSSLDGSNNILQGKTGDYNLTIYTGNNTYSIVNGYGTFTLLSFAVKPAGATEFTEVTLAKAQ